MMAWRCRGWARLSSEGARSLPSRRYEDAPVGPESDDVILYSRFAITVWT